MLATERRQPDRSFYGVLAIRIVFVGIIFMLLITIKGILELHKGTVVSGAQRCSQIGRSMLTEGGSSADAAIATLLCEGVMLPNCMGIGGGFVATIYTRERGIVETLIARESAPLAATENMFVNKSITGAIAAAVPGEILGYWNLHRRFGKLPWKRLFQPTIDLCKNGHTVSTELHNELLRNEKFIINEPSMAEIFVNTKTGEVWNSGDIMTRPELAKTLESIAENGASAMYGGGVVCKKFVSDVKNMGGLITEEDLLGYEVSWDAPVTANITGEYTLYTTSLPTSGALLALILNTISEYGSTNQSLYWHYAIETFKHANGLRTKLGDMRFEPDIETTFKKIISPAFAAEVRKKIFPDKTFQDSQYYGMEFFIPEDHGTSTTAVLDLQGNAIIVTSSINNNFGSKVRSARTGIILNDEMSDFSVPDERNVYGAPPSRANYIKPRKRALSSMCPSIILDKNGNIKMLVGAAGGSSFTTSVAQAIIKHLILNQPIYPSIQHERLQPQLVPMLVHYEKGVDEQTLNYLASVGHVLAETSDGFFSTLTTIDAKQTPIPVYDERRVEGFSAILAKKKIYF